MPGFGFERLLLGIVKCGELVTLEICAVNTSLTCSLKEYCLTTLTWAMCMGKPSSEFIAQVP